MPKLTSMHFYAWKSGLKTGMYYLRTKSAVDAIKFTLSNDSKKVQKPALETATAIVEETIGSVNAVASKGTPAAVPVEPLTPAELKTMLQQSKENEGDDCLMCGS